MGQRDSFTGGLALASYRHIVEDALREDLGTGDLTSEAVFSPDDRGEATIITREPGILAGLEVAALVFRMLDPDLEFSPFLRDGESFPADGVLAGLRGKMRAMLSGERVALNFLQRLSAVATRTRRCVELTRDYGTQILDTRKTTPGLRVLEKYAVRVGGGRNHRMGLYDAVLIKDNHIAAAGGIGPAVARVRQRAPFTAMVEVEVNSITGVKEALLAGVDIIMFDNMGVAELKAAVELVEGRAMTEASGGITEDNIREIAATGVDAISIGALTHSVRALDLSMKVG